MKSDYERYVFKRIARSKFYLGGECSRCGTRKNLEFDHVDPSTKIESISVAIRVKHWSWPRLKDELKKCQLLCKACHLVKTAENGDNTGGGRNKVHNLCHGTASMYQTRACRCDECKQAKRMYRHGLIEFSEQI